jgi:hypothetical protein
MQKPEKILSISGFPIYKQKQHYLYRYIEISIIAQSQKQSHDSVKHYLQNTKTLAFNCNHRYTVTNTHLLNKHILT